MFLNSLRHAEMLEQRQREGHGWSEDQKRWSGGSDSCSSRETQERAGGSPGESILQFKKLR